MYFTLLGADFHSRSFLSAYPLKKTNHVEATRCCDDTNIDYLYHYHDMTNSSNK
jgi:hypothetical protein